jgi:hypothetical protein
MKKQTTLWMVLGAALIAASLWGWRIYHRASNDLVTLRVTDQPLAGVIGRISSMTRERIVCDPRLEVRVNLDVRSTPLADVLDELAYQAGAAWRVTYAIHEKRADLRPLVTALQDRARLEQAGWLDLSHRPDDPGVARPDFAIHADPDTGPNDLPPQGGRRVLSDVDVRARGGPKGSGNGGENRSVRVRVGSTDNSGNQHEIDLSPERLVMQKELSSRWQPEGMLPPNEESATEVAQKTGGKVTRLFTLENLPGPMPDVRRRIDVGSQLAIGGEPTAPSAVPDI